ncbi:hypothetical protein KHA80_15690 [Anaerobacillus sp. HL2]|nr:hypothetical protein KHA80_15690 [Anaerobacillus sp. HL2]
MKKKFGKIGQKIISIDNISPEKHNTVNMYNSIGQAKHIHLLANGKIEKYTITNELNNLSFISCINPNYVSTTKFSFCFYLSKNNDVANIVLKKIIIAFFMNFSLSFLVAGASARPDSFAKISYTYYIYSLYSNNLFTF